MSRNLRPFAPFPPHRTLILTELPLDTLIHVFKFVDPPDIFSLQRVGVLSDFSLSILRSVQTCKKILELTLTRTVWMNALRRVCEINSLYKPSFPLDDMSLLDLQCAAIGTAALRFTKRLYKRKQANVTLPLLPIVSRIFTPRVVKTSNVASQDPGVLKTVDLVPGGRFLFVTTETVLHLCDLGQGAGKLIKPHALASIALLDPSGETNVSFLPTPDATGLEVSSLDNVVYTQHIYVRRLSYLPVRYSSRVPPTFLAKPGLCVFHCGEEIYVWDTTRNLWARWKPAEWPKKVFAHRDVLITIGPKDIAVWEMPTPFSPSIDSCCLDTYRSMMTLSHPFPDQDCEIPISTDWFSAVGSQPCFLSLVAWKQEKRYIARYTVQTLDSNANRNLPGCIPILMDVVPVPDTTWDELDVCDDIHPCGGDALSVWTSGSAAVVEVHISPMPLERKVAGPAFDSVRLFEAREGREPGPASRPDDFYFSLCAVTGRLCTTTLRENEILVLDFLPPN
ncbi:hypothetical protein B0H11DRAFT_2213364 [Mycena galericulata]|nr:hypothetical protein B0H11DRAFT_2213364 [Mycena galericulata]